MADELSHLQPAPGSRRKPMRKARGEGSGKGRTAGRGQKGQNSRTSGGVRLGFEGGQMPLIRRLPKRGFNNFFAKDYTVINIGELEGRFAAGAEIDIRILKDLGVVSRIGTDGLKVLGRGDISTALTIRAAKFSDTAREKIEAAGGKAEAV